MYLSFYTFTETWIQFDPQTLPMGKFVVQVIKQKKKLRRKNTISQYQPDEDPSFRSVHPLEAGN